MCPTTGKSLGVIRSIRCNADGTRVSILSDKVHGQVMGASRGCLAVLTYSSRETHWTLDACAIHAQLTVPSLVGVGDRALSNRSERVCQLSCLGTGVVQ